MTHLTTLVIVCSLSYTIGLFALSRRRRPGRLRPPDGLFFVFLVPCLNEELVIGRSLERLLAIPGRNYQVVVIDDGSDDATPELVRGLDDPRVRLFRREPPEARQGKGEALNAAFRDVCAWAERHGRDPREVVVVVVDADGRLEPDALFEVAPYFHDPRTGAVQVGVRMYNAGESLLARMQDFEFVTFTEVFQRARERVGSVGLGGNGQFTRLAALKDLGEAPWTDCLTEDLDLGVRLLVAGWSNHFCPTTWVSQQAVTSLRRLLRQRARWFQGHLQCLGRVPLVLGSRLPAAAAGDLVYHLLSPLLVLATSLAMAVFLFALVALVADAPQGAWHALTHPDAALLALLYAVSFGLAPCYGFAYWLRDRRTSLPRAIGLAHLFHVYAYLWFAAGWMALGRAARRRRSWAKTARTPEAAPAGR